MLTELCNDCTNLGSMAPSNQADLQLLPSFKASPHFHQGVQRHPRDAKCITKILMKGDKNKKVRGSTFTFCFKGK